MDCAVAISGGVDSMMTAHLLLEAGHRVMGVHFTHGFESSPDGSDSKIRAARIAERLGIPFYHFNLAQVFKTHVVDYFVDAYSSGITPNPCMQCNPMVKFGALFEAAQKLGAQKLATGHYARIEAGPGGTPDLLRGVDPLKDQSYFLARLSRVQLSRTIFPLGELRKQAVREMAVQAGFSTLVGSESQDVCFIDNGGYHAFLEKHPGFISTAGASGEIVDLDGNILGRHGGLHHYTIGQRRGINCSAAEALYVIALDSNRNRLIVGPKAAQEAAACNVVDINWLMDKADAPFTAWVKVRYRHQPVLAEIQPTGSKGATIVFKKPQTAVTPGQGAVFYDKDRVLGGGWIEKPKIRSAEMKAGN